MFKPKIAIDKDVSNAVPILCSLEKLFVRKVDTSTALLFHVERLQK